MMESLPVDLVTRVLEHSLMPERLNLASCSTGYARRKTFVCSVLDLHSNTHISHLL